MRDGKGLKLLQPRRRRDRGGEEVGGWNLWEVDEARMEEGGRRELAPTAWAHGSGGGMQHWNGGRQS